MSSAWTFLGCPISIPRSTSTYSRHSDDTAGFLLNDVDASYVIRTFKESDTYIPTSGQFASQMELAAVRRVCLPDVERDCSVDLGRQRYI
ncbi:unnamed protein product [Lasius platythorax]|uniref:Uncharacterized protein n=1 Tax=Lasius platythorax TaxID=488582 RepID=A0AAV2NJ62_9HYME